MESYAKRETKDSSEEQKSKELKKQESAEIEHRDDNDEDDDERFQSFSNILPERTSFKKTLSENPNTQQYLKDLD